MLAKMCCTFQEDSSDAWFGVEKAAQLLVFGLAALPKQAAFECEGTQPLFCFTYISAIAAYLLHFMCCPMYGTCNCYVVTEHGYAWCKQY
jgi:hypothetical protein